MFEIRQDGAKPGSVLMREDEALLRSMDEGNAEPLLRFYEWATPTVSLGFHQSETAIAYDRLTQDGLDWVRRPTGGAAVLHSEELTYSIVMPLDSPQEAANLQERVSQALADGLRAAGVDAQVEERGEPLSALPNRVSCFVRTSRWEVTVRGKKIVGSAQRKLTKAILQHGSILTGDDHLRIADYLIMRDENSRNSLKRKLRERATSLSSELGRSVDMAELRQAMEHSFSEVFNKQKNAAHAHGDN
jgi:lipoyl(octanoyl) transferase